MNTETEKIAQRIYTQLLKDDRLRCTCDQLVREDSYFQAKGHYHNCMLWQVARAIQVSLLTKEALK
jgi:hypothetical protein